MTIGRRIRRPKRIGGDKGYDSDGLRAALRRRSIAPCFTPRENHTPRLTPRERREQRYSCQRWKVERNFSWINNNRRIDRFMEKSARTYQSFLYLVFIKHYLTDLSPLS